MDDVAPHTPEARSRRFAHAREDIDRNLARLKPAPRVMEVIKRVASGVFSDGFTHAGNIAYLTILTLFPFIIVAAAAAQLFGRSADTQHFVNSFLRTMPKSVGDLLAAPIAAVIHARTGSLLWLGAATALWTVGSYIETIRDILRRAYGTRGSRGFMHYRIGSILFIIGSVFVMIIAFVAQGVLAAVEQFIYRLLPWAEHIGVIAGVSRLVPAVVMFGALYGLLYTLTPSKYRYSACPKWPGALLITIWWIITTGLLPRVLALLGGYDLTYGSMAGVIIALFFFWIIGLGLVVGAHLNAALAETPEPALEEKARSD